MESGSLTLIYASKEKGKNKFVSRPEENSLSITFSVPKLSSFPTHIFQFLPPEMLETFGLNICFAVPCG